MIPGQTVTNAGPTPRWRLSWGRAMPIIEAVSKLSGDASCFWPHHGMRRVTRMRSSSRW